MVKRAALAGDEVQTDDETRASDRNGDWRGLIELRRDVERTLARSCRDQNELEDMVQETLLRAALFRHSLQDDERLRPWVMRIAWNVLRDHVRRETRLQRTDVGEDFLAAVECRDTRPVQVIVSAGLEIGDSTYEDEDVLELLMELLPGLSDDDRSLYEAYYGEGLGCRRAARRLAVSTQTVKMRLFRLRRRLRRALCRETHLRLSARPSGVEAVA